MLRLFWAQSRRISAVQPRKTLNTWMAVHAANCAQLLRSRWFWFLFVPKAHLSLITRRAHISTILLSVASLLPLIWASQAGPDTRQTFCHPLFLFPTPPLLSVSHHTVFHASSLPHSLLALNDTVYTYPASIIPFHTSPGLFICLGCWGDMKAHTPLLHSPIPFPSFYSSLPPLLAACGHWYTRVY